jgi:hypothetical protein
MTGSFYLALALCVPAIPGDLPAGGYAAQPANQQPAYYAQSNMRGGPVRTWFRNRFSGHSRNVVMPAGAEPISAMPTPAVSAQPPVTSGYLNYSSQYQPAPLPGGEPPLLNGASGYGAAQQGLTVDGHGAISSMTTVTSQRPNLQMPEMKIAKQFENKVGHETDYSWITGSLFYVHADGGRWVVRYALPGEVDKFGGSVVLAPGVEMRNFREGDLVCVHGQVLNEGRASRSLGGALYRVNAINMIERADQ